MLPEDASDAVKYILKNRKIFNKLLDKWLFIW